MNALTPRLSGTPIPAVASTEPTEFTFMFGDQPIRGLAFGDKPVFLTQDVAEALFYRDAANLNRLLKPREKGTHSVSTLGGIQRKSTITEAGLYRAIMQRKLANEADPLRRIAVERFQDWVVADVLPKIRRFGTYSTAPLPIPAPVQIDVRDQQQLAVIATQLIALTGELKAELEDKTRALAAESQARQVTTVALSEAHGRIDAQRPAVLAHERLAMAEDSLTLSEAAVTLFVPRGRLIDHLLELGYLTRFGVGTRERLRCTLAGNRSGWVRQGPKEVQRDDGRVVPGFHPYVTGAGMAGLAEHFCRGVQATRQPTIPGV